MSSILLKIVTGAIHLKNNRREAKNMMEEVDKELHGLGIVKPVHRFGIILFIGGPPVGGNFSVTLYCGARPAGEWQQEFYGNEIFSRFYELASQYYQMEGDHGEYYRNSLKYLGVIDLSKMNQSEQQSKAFSLGISALLASVSKNSKYSKGWIMIL